MNVIELRKAALQKLQVLAAGEDAEPEDGLLIQQKYEALHAQLTEKNLAVWALSEDIPAKVQEPVIAMLAAMSVDEFGIAEPRRTAMIAAGALDLPQPSIAERQLRKVLSSAYIASPLVTCYY